MQHHHPPTTGPASVVPVADGADTWQEDTAVRDGLEETPPRLPAWFGYDSVGSELFERITELPTYHLTRAERGLLEQHAPEMAQLVDARQIAELGSGSAKKTRLLLESCLGLHETTYLPIDVSRQMLESSSAALRADLPRLNVIGLWGRYEAGLEWLRTHTSPPLVIAFLGSNLGNATPAERDMLLAEIARTLRPGDRFLVSADLDKPRDVLETCYNDPAGHSAFADFRLNYLTQLNRRYGATFKLDDFHPRAHYNPATSTVEGHLYAADDHSMPMPGLGLTLKLRRGDSINVGFSAKFHYRGLADEIGTHGFRLQSQWQDSQTQYGVFIFCRV